MMLAPSDILIATVAIAIVAIILIIRGWRGRRIDDHPLCRKCGYDLIATATSNAVIARNYAGDQKGDRVGGTANCPECGRDVSSPRAIRIGHRRKRRIPLTLGLMLPLISVGGAGFIGWSMSSNFNWYPYKPLWMLRQEAGGTQWNKAQRATNEILARLAASKLSQSQIDSIVAEGLAAQSNPNATWHGWWGDFIEQAWQAGVVSDQTVIQYARTAIEGAYSMRIPQRIRERGMLTIAFAHKPMRAGRTSTIKVEISRGPVTLDEGAIISGGGGHSSSSVSSGNSGTSASGSTNRLPQGQYCASSDIHVRLTPSTYNGLALTTNGFGEADGVADNPKPLAEFTMKRQASFEVVAQDAEVVERVRDSTLAVPLAPEILRAASVRKLMATNTNQWAVIMCDVDINSPPIGVAFDVFVRIGEKDWPAGTVAAEADGHALDGVGVLRPKQVQSSGAFPSDATEAEVVLRSNAALAERAGIIRMWEGEIVIKGVPIEYTRPRGR